MTRAASQPDGPLPARLRVHVERLAGLLGPRNLQHPTAYAAAEAYVARELAAAGYDVRRIPFAVGRNEAANLEATRPGRCGEVVVVGAHYDTCADTPGADDNASAVAGLIELARLLRQGSRPRRTIRLVAFANEEWPHFHTDTMGSFVCARDLQREADAGGVRVAGMLCLEMIGYFRTSRGSQPYPPQIPRVLRPLLPSRGDFLALLSDVGSAAWTYRLRAKMGRSNRPDKSLPRLPIWALAIPPAATGGSHMLSDHASFRAQGFPAAMLTDTAFVRNPHYHLPSDLPDTLDYPRMAQAIVRVARALRRV